MVCSDLSLGLLSPDYWSRNANADTQRIRTDFQNTTQLKMKTLIFTTLYVQCTARLKTLIYIPSVKWLVIIEDQGASVAHF